MDNEFKFKWINDNGQETSFMSKKGSFDGKTLRLEDAEIPAAAITFVDTRENRMIVAVAQQEGAPATLVFSMSSGKGAAERLKEGLGKARSHAWAQNHRKELNEQGRGHEFREAACPHCQATINLTGQPETPQVYCEFCHAITNPNPTGPPAKAEKEHRLCDECGMYSKPRKFTIFYFYFLLVVYGFSSSSTWRCPACMRPEAWKMLFGNLLFVLGVPVAIAQLIRAYGGTDVGGPYPGLDAANIKARKGNVEAAVTDYRKILAKTPVTAGVKYNLALAFLQREQWDNAMTMLEFCLADCANYEPAAQALAGVYEHLGETEKLETLKKRWGVEETEETTEAPMADAADLASEE
ncbi:MAG: hypothetical protein AAF589_04780 [Planctomycetota bacterium]